MCTRFTFVGERIPVTSNISSLFVCFACDALWWTHFRHIQPFLCKWDLLCSSTRCWRRRWWTGDCGYRASWCCLGDIGRGWWHGVCSCSTYRRKDITKHLCHCLLFGSADCKHYQQLVPLLDLQVRDKVKKGKRYEVKRIRRGGGSWLRLTCASWGCWGCRGRSSSRCGAWCGWGWRCGWSSWGSWCACEGNHHETHIISTLL